MNGWDGLLAPGERIVWQGRPDRRLRLEIRDPMEFGLGLSMTLGPAAPMLLLWLGGGSGWVWMLPTVALGLWFLVGTCLWDAYRRSRTWYSLSDRRAFVATALLGQRRLRDRPLGAAPRHDRQSPGSLDFAAPGERLFRFERIADAWAVRDLATLAGVAAR
jgi:hypothetical protein